MEMKRILALMAATVVAAGFLMGRGRAQKSGRTAPFRMHTLFAVECGDYFDWQTVGLMHSYRKARQPGPITRLLSCTDEEKQSYRGMDLAPTLEVPSMITHPKTGDMYRLINKPAGIVYWLKHSKDAQNVDWVIILDSDVIIHRPIIPWELGAQRGRPVTVHYGHSVGCDIVLAKLHAEQPELCDKVGGLLVIHIDDLQALAPVWLSKTEQVWRNRSSWATNYTGDIYETGWISETYGYLLGAAEIGLRYRINDDLMIYSGYIPEQGIEPIVMHYGLTVSVGNWSFSKLEHREDDVVYDCHRLFSGPPYPNEVQEMEADPNKRRALFLYVQCINTLNEGLLLQHATYSCPEPKGSKYLSFLRSKTFAELKQLAWQSRHIMEVSNAQKRGATKNTNPKIHTLFSADCSPYFDWQSLGLVYSFNNSGQPGGITRLLTCTQEELKKYKGHDLVPTHHVPSMSRHPITRDWYPAINKPAAIVHWINHVKIDVEYIVILEADMIMKGPITPWEFNASHGRPVSTPYDHLIGCDNKLAKIHTRYPKRCNKVGGVIIMHIRDVRRFALLWLHKTEQLRADIKNWSKNITGDSYEAGWMSQMYGYVFAAAELRFQHVISNKILIHPGNVPLPGVKYRVFHYNSGFKVGDWSFDKANWTESDMVNKCWAKFPDPPDPSTLEWSNEGSLLRDLLSIACVNSLNEALRAHHESKKCPDPSTILLSPPAQKAPEPPPTPTEKTSLPPLKREATNRIEASRKIGTFDQFGKLSPPSKWGTYGMFTSIKFCVVGVWGVSVFVFLVVLWMIISGQRGHKKRGKAFTSKRSFPLGGG